MSGRQRLVVVGGGMAATACLEDIARLDPEKYDITVFGAEEHVGYNRVLLGQVLTGEKGLDEIGLLEPGWFERHGVKVHAGTRVDRIDRNRRKVVSGGLRVPYDRLLLATGSVPIIPEMEGTDKTGVSVFRDVRDCERIRGLVGRVPGKKAVVIGGGLLGLEAAHLLTRLDAEVTVVHLAERLMERQLDEVASIMLREKMEGMGIRFALGRRAAELKGGDRVESLVLSDGSSVDADVVVVCAGIRPNAELARASGIHCSRGVVVSDTMQTFDPAVYAVGECVEHRGRTFGLVAPVFEQARVAADHLAGSSRRVFKSSPAQTRLKVPGVDIFSAGDPEPGGAETVEYLDRGAGFYKRLSIRDGKIEGIILLGDTSDAQSLFSSLCSGEDVSGRRRSLLLGGGRRDTPVDEMADEAIVCGCNGVTKKMIVDAAASKGLFSLDEVRKETGASGSCGGCAATVERILQSTLGPVYKAGAKEALCACTNYTREDVLKNIRGKGLRTVAGVMETMGWETVGCDTCRPAISYYLKMVSPAEAVDDPTSRVINERTHANIQGDGTFSVVPRMRGGVVTPGELKRLAEVAESFKVPLVKITGGQRIGLFGIRREDLPRVWARLKMPSGFAYAKAVRTVKTCVGSRWCRYGTQDSLALGRELEARLEGLWTPAKVKMGVEGCPRGCAEGKVKDVGLTGVAGGWEIRVGGCAGVELREGARLATVDTGEEALEIAAAFVQLYREDAFYGERTFRWVERRSIQWIRERVVEDLSSREGLCRRLREVLELRRDPWEEASGSPGERKAC